jgi:hypothetical protein
MHEKQVNDRYDPQAIRACRAQLDHALFAALHTNKDTATYWVEESERLAGKIAIAEAGGTIRSAINLIPEGERHYLCRKMPWSPRARSCASCGSHCYRRSRVSGGSHRAADAIAGAGGRRGRLIAGNYSVSGATASLSRRGSHPYSARKSSIFSAETRIVA